MAGRIANGIFDLSDPNDAASVLRLYGPPLQSKGYGMASVVNHETKRICRHRTPC